MDISLPTQFLNLAKRIRELVSADQAAGVIQQVPVLHKVIRVQQIVYKQGVQQSQSSVEYVPLSMYTLQHKMHFQTKIRTLPEYSQCFTLIREVYGASQPEPDYAMHRFCERLVDETLAGDREDALVAYVSLFLNDLNKGNTIWQARVWLEGVWLEDEEFRVGQDKVLRRPVAADFESQFPIDMSSYMDLAQPPSHPSAILEFQMLCREYREPETIQKRLVDVLRLFRLGSIKLGIAEYTPHSIVDFGMKHGGDRGSCLYRFGLMNSDKALFDRTFHAISPLLYASESEPDQAFSSSAVNLAFERYKEALLQLLKPDGRIAAAVTCLEALYLRGQERSELSHKLSQRVAMVVGNFGFNPIEVYRQLKDAYNIRSMFVHGATLEKEEQQSTRDVDEICRKTLEYARISILVYLQIDQEQGKEKLITRLDHALLDEKARHKLKEQLQRLVVPIEGRVTEAQSEDSADSQPDD